MLNDDYPAFDQLLSQVEFPWSLLVKQPFTLVSDFSAVFRCSETAKSVSTRWVQNLLCFRIVIKEEVWDTPACNR